MSYLAAFEKFVLAEWEVLSGAPTHFILAVALVGMVIFLGIRVFYKQQIVILTAHRELARDQAVAAEDAQKSLEDEVDRLRAEIARLKEAIERDAAQRDQEVSAAVKVATTAMENAMERVSLSSSTVSHRLAAHLAAWDVSPGALLGDDEPSTKDKDKPRSKSKD